MANEKILTTKIHLIISSNENRTVRHDLHGYDIVFPSQVSDRFLPHRILGHTISVSADPSISQTLIEFL